MTAPDPFPNPEPGLDAIVRAQIDAEAARADAHGMATRVLARLATDSPAEPPRPRRSWRRRGALVGFVALAATVLLAVFVFSGPREAVASPAEVVQAARDSSTRNDARCYRVTLELPTRARETVPLLALISGPRTLCTRGKQFVVEPGFGGRGAWGRDETGRVWVAPTRDAAVAFDEAELPPALRTALKVHELELTSLLDEVLVDFDLTWSEPPTPTADAYSVTAKRRGEVAPLRIAAAELVIEKDTKVIRSLAVHRKGLHDGIATITFSLLATETRDDAAFTPEGHINPGTPIYDRSKPGLRRRLVLQQIGEMLSNGP